MTDTNITIEVPTREFRRIRLPYFAKIGGTYIWIAGKKVDGGPIGHTIYTDGSILLNSFNASDAFSPVAVEISAAEFWARWNEAVAALDAMKGGAE